MATPDMVWIVFPNDTDVLEVASEALPRSRVGKGLVRIDRSMWPTWPWENSSMTAGETIRGWFVARDEEGRVLFLSGGADYFLFRARDVEVIDYGPEADLSLAWDIEGANDQR
jgi:hypothetical protein